MTETSIKCRIPKLLLIFVGIRAFNAMITCTFFQADEFWQCLEPAHFKAFGYGKLTWEWQQGLRSYAFPLLFEIGYRLVSMLVRVLDRTMRVIIHLAIILHKSPNLESRLMRGVKTYSEILEYYAVLFMPKIIMSVIAAIGEYYTMKWIQKIHLITLDKRNDTKKLGDYQKLRRISLLLTLTNFFNCFVSTRTFINSFEMSLTSVALYYWDWSGGVSISTGDFSVSLTIAIFTCLQRPSNVLIWLILGGFLLVKLAFSGEMKKITYLIRKIILILISTVAFNALIDYYFYERLVFPVFHFMKFNFTTSLSSFYGVAPWHFHLTQSLPLILGYSIPVFTYGLLTSLSDKQYSRPWMNPWFQVKSVVVFNIIAYSLLGHKEFRFIYALQPFFILISSVSAIKVTHNTHLIRENNLKVAAYVLSGISVLIACILNLISERGVISVMVDFHKQKHIDSIGFLMPCHSTPWQSHLHNNHIRELWSVSCDPPIHLLDDPAAGEKLPHYMDESDYLYDNIPKFIRQNFPPLLPSEDHKDPNYTFRYEWPEYLVIFEHLDDAYMKSYLKGTSYAPFSRYFNSLSHWDHRRQGDVIIYKKS